MFRAKQEGVTICPACKINKLHEVEVMNASSRYKDVYVCSHCGACEAFEGDFWNPTSLDRLRMLRSKQTKKERAMRDITGQIEK